MYNLSSNAAKFKIGMSIRTEICCGIDSNKKGKVIAHFEAEGYDKYLQMDQNWIPVELESDNGPVKTYMPASYLIKT